MKYSKVFFPIVIIEEESGKKEVKLHSCARLFAISWIVACQAPPSMGFSRQEYWSGLPFPSQGIFLTQGSNPSLPHCRQTEMPSNVVSFILVLLFSETGN